MEWMPTKSGLSQQTERCTVLRGTLKGMCFSLEDSFVRSAYEANETQHGNRDITQSLNQAFGRGIDFQHVLDDFFWGAVQR